MLKIAKKSLFLDFEALGWVGGGVGAESDSERGPARFSRFAHAQEAILSEAQRGFRVSATHRKRF